MMDTIPTPQPARDFTLEGPWVSLKTRAHTLFLRVLTAALASGVKRGHLMPDSLDLNLSSTTY